MGKATREQLVAQIRGLRARVAELEKTVVEKERVQDSLQRSEDRYRTVFENTGTGTFVKERDMTLSMVNSGFERLTGYTKAQIEGRMKWTDLIYEEDRDRMVGYHTNRRKSTGAPTELTCRIVDSHRRIKEVILKLDLIPGTSRSIGSFMDITRLMSAEQEVLEGRARLKAIMEGFEGLIYAADNDFNLLYMNQRLIAEVGRDATGERCYRALHHRESVCPFCVHIQVQQGETARFELQNPRNGRWHYSVNSPIHHTDGSISLLALVTDIHERKISELALKASEDLLRKENTRLRSSINQRFKFSNIVGRSAAMQAVYRQIVDAADSDANVIIYGEPGTGKELVAHAVHDMSHRREHRFVPVHCGAIPENLAESEFFGYMKGAFSGASMDRQGYIDFADQGTLFLDEIGEISLHLQVKLLRVIEGGWYTPVGSNQVSQADIRIIAATNRDLKGRIDEGLMREDFFYRIHILPIHLPPLRERKDDIPLLVDHFLMLYGGKENLPPLSGATLKNLVDYDWPGNVRELQNVIIRYISSKRIDLLGQGLSKTDPRAALSLKAPALVTEKLKVSMANHEKRILMATLEKVRWHRGQAAARLGIDRKTLFTKMKRHGLLPSP